ncbi:hypothetical protein RRF57_009541 [Xylaria bambusicola]|uniref:Uncharacterized protein n=1 Tax=Xylaria bambusicola TaxID=326684 RepID=A0AAN7Z7X2_9PEZI
MERVAVLIHILENNINCLYFVVRDDEFRLDVECSRINAFHSEGLVIIYQTIKNPVQRRILKIGPEGGGVKNTSLKTPITNGKINAEIP